MSNQNILYNVTALSVLFLKIKHLENRTRALHREILKVKKKHPCQAGHQVELNILIAFF